MPDRRDENCLMKDKKFGLEGKNTLKNTKNNVPINAIIIDATEIQIQRPKKRNFKN
jgi:hypothetical protein